MAFCAKIVPDNDPNADGEWIVVQKDLPRHLAMGRLYHWVEKYIPRGKHVVRLADGDKIPSPG